MRIAWATDLHLDHAGDHGREKFADEVIAQNSTALLITGDISSSKTVEFHLHELQKRIGIAIYYVLGNHDYYRGSIFQVRDFAKNINLGNGPILWMPHLGVLASVHPRAAMEVFERDCLVYLGTCIAPNGQPKPGQPVCHYTFEGELQESGELRGGEIIRLRLDVGQIAQVVLQPARGFDVGSGPGRVDVHFRLCVCDVVASGSEVRIYETE